MSFTSSCSAFSSRDPEACTAAQSSCPNLHFFMGSLVVQNEQLCPSTPETCSKFHASTSTLDKASIIAMAPLQFWNVKSNPAKKNGTLEDDFPPFSNHVICKFSTPNLDHTEAFTIAVAHKPRIWRHGFQRQHLGKPKGWQATKRWVAPMTKRRDANHMFEWGNRLYVNHKEWTHLMIHFAFATLSGLKNLKFQISGA